MSGHQLPYELQTAPFQAADPGTGEAIPVTRWNQSIGFTIAASASETNTLAAPESDGQRLRLYASTVGSGGSRVVTAAAALNVSGHLTITFDAAGEMAVLESFPVGDDTFRWRVTASNGATVG